MAAIKAVAAPVAYRSRSSVWLACAAGEWPDRPTQVIRGFVAGELALPEILRPIVRKGAVWVDRVADANVGQATVEQVEPVPIVWRPLVIPGQYHFLGG